MEYFFEREKNYNRIDALVATECSKRCLANFKSDRLSSNENLCLSSCANKFYDALIIGDNVYSNHLDNKNKDN